MAQPEAPKSPKEPKPASPSKLVNVVLGLVMLNLGATGFVVYRVMQPIQVQSVAAPAASASDHEGGPTIPLESFLVNLNEPGSSRYLKTTLEMELVNEHAGEEVTKRKPAVRDELLRYLSSLSVADTMGEERKDKIQSDLLARAEKVLGTGKVKKLFFSEFVVQ